MMSSPEAHDPERNITAFFDTRDAAERAIIDLTETGLPRERILLRAGAARRSPRVEDGKSLLQEVKELVLPSDSPDANVASLRREGFLLTIRPDPGAHDHIVEMLQHDGGVDVDSREDIWPGWKSDPAQAQQDVLVTLDGTPGGAGAPAETPVDTAEPASEPDEPPAPHAATARELRS